MGPVFAPDGSLLYFFASQLDVSRRREADQQFREAQKMEAIGQLTAGLALDFNNLLHIICGSLERLGAKRHDDRLFARYHAAATAAAERGAKLTHQLLAFARRGRLEPKGVDLSRLVNDVADLLESSAGAKARLHLNLQRRLPLVKVDINHLEMALLNIVVNARDASPNGGSITVTTRDLRPGDPTTARQKSGDHVLLSIADEGEGMEPHVLARATEPFFTTKPRGSGTGLGLAMVHGFAQQSGGRLAIDSAPGQGTTINLIFPPHDGGEDAEDGRELAGDTGYQPQPLDPGLPTPRILVADDNREAAMAADVLACVGSGPDGMEMARQVQARAPTTLVLLTTGYNDEMALNGPQPHAMDVLGKPFRRSELIDRVQAVLKQGRRGGPTRETSEFGYARA